MKPDHTEKIRCLTPALLLALKTRALDPDTTANTEPFKKNTSNKKGSAKKNVTICRRGALPDHKRDQFGSPTSILAIIEKIELNSECDPPVQLPQPTEPVLPPPPFQPEGNPVPPVLPERMHADASWRLPVFLAILAALASATLYVRGTNESVPENTTPVVQSLAPSLPPSEASNASLANNGVASRPAATASNEFPNCPPSAALFDAAHSGSRQAPKSLPASSSSGSIPHVSKLAEVFAAIAAQHNQRQSALGALARPSSGKPFTGNLDDVATILATLPTADPIVPRLPAELKWPESALVTTIRKNLRAVSYEDGTLVLWAKDPNALCRAFATSGDVITGVDGWRSGSWDYTVRENRIEVREVVEE